MSVKSFDVTFSEMANLKSVTSAGSGLVGVILPDTTSSTRYVDFDAPYLAKAFQMAGYTSSQYKIDNAQGSDATELALAQADISRGAKVLIFDPLDSTVGAQVQAYAASHGVQLISYDRATFAGNNTYYVSFDNERSWQAHRPGLHGLRGGLGSHLSQGLRVGRWSGHRPERGLLRPGLQLGGLGQVHDPVACRNDEQQGVHAGRRQDHPRIG